MEWPSGGMATHAGAPRIMVGEGEMAVSLLYRGGGFFYRTFLRCGTDSFESRALASYVLKRYVR